MATVERTRGVDTRLTHSPHSLQQARSLSNSMNSSASGSAASHRSAESKSSGSELLSITDAAVRALEKTQDPKVNCYADKYMGSSVCEEGIRLFSPREITVTSQFTNLSECLFSPQQSENGFNIGRLSIGSQNSTRTDCSGRASDAEGGVPSVHDVSNLSRASNASRVSSTFLTGQAKPVKVMSKMLKEIKSPFQDGTSDGNVTARSQEAIESPKSSHSHQELAQDSMHSQTKVHQYSPRLKESEIRHGENTPHFSQLSKQSSTKHGKLLEPSTLTESGYITQSVKVMTGQSESLGNLGNTEGVSTLKDLPSMTEEILTDRSQLSQCPIDIVAHENLTPIPDASLTQPDISSAAENSLKDNIQSNSQELRLQNDSKQHKETLENRFSKFQTSGLKQGTLRDVDETSERHSEGQVQISQCALSDRQKQLKQALVNRSNGQTAIKKQVTAKVLVSAEPRPIQESSKVKSESITDAATTAAVAAASAVAATQPFLKAQQDMELRIAQMMQQIGSFGGQKGAPDVEHVDTKQTQKLDDFERQLNNLTQRRLDYLEEMQKQQLQWQAKLMSVSRERSTNKHIAPADFQHGPLSKHRAVKKSVLADDDQQFIHYRPHQQIEKEKSVLDTPAPRRHPPTPTSIEDSRHTESQGHIMEHVTPDRKQHKSGSGLLAHILSADDERRGRTSLLGTPQSSFLTPNRLDVSRRDEEVSPGQQGRTAIHSKPQHMHVAGFDRDAAMLAREKGPAPLDHYLTKPSMPPSSPYPKLKDVMLQSNAPVRGHFTEASTTLHGIVQSRKYLEANMEAILRNRQETDVYSLLEQVNQDSLMPERVRIQKMVDMHIQDMNHNLEKEVMEELLKLQESKKNVENFMIPERDTTVAADKPSLKAPAGRLVMSKVKGRAEARIDSGLRKARMDGSGDVAQLREKENIPIKKLKKAKATKLLDSSTYKTRVYGKTATYSPQRATQREPYLRFRSTSPKARSPKAVGRPVEAKGVVMSSARTQVGSGYVPPPTQGSRGQLHSRPSKVPQQMVTMAIPLGAPRKDGGLTAPITFPSRPSPGPVTSTPLDQSPITGVLTMRDPLLDDEELQLDLNRKKNVKLDIHPLPPVDIQPVKPDTSSDTSKSGLQYKLSVNSVDVQPVKPNTTNGTSKSLSKSKFSDNSGKSCDALKYESKSMQPAKPKTTDGISKSKLSDKSEKGSEVFVSMKPEQSEQSSSEEDDDLTITEVDSAPIDIPGYKVPESTYHGPAFPPQAPSLIGAPPTSHQLAEGIRQRDILQDQALQWVEQELMAQVLSEFYAKQAEVGSAPPMVARVTRPRHDTDSTESDYSDMSSHNPLIAEGLGQDGLQLFIDAGQPVDDKLVNALLKEVMTEKILAAVGSRTSQDDEGWSQRPRDARSTPTPSPRRQKQLIDSPIQMPTELIETPQATPRHTPPRSPALHQGTPPVTPDHSPPPSIVSAPHAPVIIEREDSEISESVKTNSEEEDLRYRRLMEVHAVEMMTPVGESTRLADYDVMTPDLTPRLSPAPHDVRTPSPSLRTASPEPEPQPTTPEPEPSLTDEQSAREVAAGPEKPITFSVAIQAEVEEVVAPSSPPPPSPALQERHLSGSSSEESSITTSITSETFNENISEGQWLVTLHSEGELPGLPADHDLRDRIRQHLMAGARGRAKDDDTFLDADDLDADQDVADLPSEGEFLHVPSIIQGSNMNPSTGWPLTVQPSGGWPPAQSPGLAIGVNHSVGEITFGQKAPLLVEQQDMFFGQPQSRKAPNNSRRSRGLLDDHKALGGIHERDEADDTTGSRDPSGTNHQVVSAPPPPIPSHTIPAKAQSRPMMSTLMAGGREPSRHYRPSSGPGARSRTSPLSRSLSPDMLSGRDKQADVRLSQTSGRDVRQQEARQPETRISQTSLQGTSELDTQTPDQINIDTLLQSRDYLATTESDFGSTAGDFETGQSDRFLRSGTDLGLSSTGGRYFRGTMGSTSDMSLSPGLTQTLERSSDEVAQQNRLSYTAESDSDLFDLRAAGRPRDTRGQDEGRHEPLQVSVTLPSMGEESSGTQESYEDVSELSLGGV